MSNTRQSGYYWVKWYNDWEVAQWDADAMKWLLCGDELPNEDAGLNEINENRIPTPDECSLMVWGNET